MAKKEKENKFETVEFETFRKPSFYFVDNLTQLNPSCFNGEVSIFKYKIKFELIEEPKEVYQERLQKLWEEEDNFHHYDPIKKMAEKLGVVLEGDFGRKRNKK